MPFAIHHPSVSPLTWAVIPNTYVQATNNMGDLAKLWCSVKNATSEQSNS